MNCDENLIRRIWRILIKWKAEIGYEWSIQFRYSDGILTLFTPYPGVLIGYHGEIIKKYRKIFSEEMSSFKEVQFMKTDNALV